MRRLVFLFLVACGHAEAPPAQAIVIPANPPPAPPAPAVDASTADVEEPQAPNGMLDLDRATRVALGASPLKAAAPKPIGERPPKTRVLKEVSRVADKAPLARAEARPSAPYDPKRVNEVHGDKVVELPGGARSDIPTSYKGEPLSVISESGKRLVLVYGARHVVIVDGKKVERILDMDPPELPLSKDDRAFSDVHQAFYADGIAYVCRGYNGWLRTRKGYVTAVDVATGEMRWRSPAQTCGGSVTVIGDYVLTGYGEDVMPYVLVLLRRADGTVVQQIRNDGAALDFLVDGESVVVETYKHRITYRLQ